MNKYLRLPLLVALAASGLFFSVGCASFDSRAREKAALFATLTPEVRARLEVGDVRLGDTPDLVYLALGRPTEKKERLTAEGHVGTWVYSTAWQEYQGTRLVDYRRDVVYDAKTKRHHVILTPDYQPVYVPRAEDRIRVTFTAGVVSSLEKVLPRAKPESGLVR